LQKKKKGESIAVFPEASNWEIIANEIDNRLR
jgi:hypothetical protein